MTTKEILERIDYLEENRGWENGHEMTDELLALYRRLRHGPNKIRANLAGDEAPDTTDAEVLYAEAEKEQVEKEYMATVMVSGTRFAMSPPRRESRESHQEPYRSSDDNTPLAIAIGIPLLNNMIQS